MNAIDTLIAKHHENKSTPFPMKSIATLYFTAALFVATSGAFADDPQLQNRLAMQRAQAAREKQPTTTIAVYVDRRGVGRTVERQAPRPESRYEVTTDAHGHARGAYVPAR